MKIGALVIDVNYPDDLLKRNRAYVVFIIDRKTDKVVNTTVVERDTLPQWFMTKKLAYEQDKYKYVIAALSVAGELLDFVEDAKTIKPVDVSVN